jgi:FixJ family two-component response regulator
VKVFASAEEFLKSDYLRDTGCLILDVRMPGMSGIELHRHLVVNHWEIPVIFITAHGSEQETRSRAIRDGAVDYLSKPFSEDALLNAVRTALGPK